MGGIKGGYFFSFSKYLFFKITIREKYCKIVFFHGYFDDLKLNIKLYEILFFYFINKIIQK